MNDHTSARLPPLKLPSGTPLTQISVAEGREAHTDAVPFVIRTQNTAQDAHPLPSTLEAADIIEVAEPWYSIPETIVTMLPEDPNAGSLPHVDYWIRLLNQPIPQIKRTQAWFQTRLYPVSKLFDKLYSFRHSTDSLVTYVDNTYRTIKKALTTVPDLSAVIRKRKT